MSAKLLTRLLISLLNSFLYKSYWRFHTIRIWRQRHFTHVGVMMLWILFLSGLLGFNISKTNIYQLFALSFSIISISFLLNSFPFNLKIEIKRILPEYAGIGDKLTYELEIINLSSKTQKGLILYENIDEPRPSLKELLLKKEPFEHTRNFWDRRTLYYRWSWLVHKNMKAYFSPVTLPDLPPGETIRMTAQFTPHYRGYIQFAGFTLARPDIIGLFNRLINIKNNQKMLVLPKQYQLEIPNFKSTRQYHPGGVNFASSIGNSDEFISLRQYRPGDPLRNIHWRSFAKTNELVIKEFEDEHFVRHALIMDTFLASEDEAIFEAGISTASSYISSNISIRQSHESILDLIFVGNKIYSFSSGRGLAESEKMLELLACAEPNENKTILELLPLLESSIGKFSSSICIFLGWNQGHKKIYRLFKQALIPIFIVVLAQTSEKDHSFDQTQTKSKLEEVIFQDKNNLQADIKVVSYNQIQKELGAK